MKKFLLLLSAFQLFGFSALSQTSVTVDANGTVINVKEITFKPTSAHPGLNVGSVSSNPSSLANGDLWYNSTANALNARINGATVSLGAGGGGGTWGSITGTLSNQTDLNAALGLKLNTSQASAYALTLMDDADATAARATLGLGTSATVNTGTTSGTIPLLGTGGRLDSARLPSDVLYTGGVLALGGFSSITGRVGTANLPLGTQLYDNTGGTALIAANFETRKLIAADNPQVNEVLEINMPETPGVGGTRVFWFRYDGGGGPGIIFNNGIPLSASYKDAVSYDWYIGWSDSPTPDQMAQKLVDLLQEWQLIGDGSLDGLIIEFVEASDGMVRFTDTDATHFHNPYYAEQNPGTPTGIFVNSEIQGVAGTNAVTTLLDWSDETKLKFFDGTSYVTSAGVFTGNGSGLTTLNASNLSSGTVAPARLGSGSGGSSKFLREDNTWQTITPGSGTVTSFSAGDLSPLFTTSEATVTTTPALTFALSNAAAHSIFGNFTGGSGAPSYNALGTGVDTWLTTPTLANLNSAVSDDDVAGLAAANTFTGAQINSKSGAASTSAMKYSGVPFAGTGTTSFPLVYIQDANATASTTLNTVGTYFGVNGDGTQDLMNLLKDGTSQFLVSSTGAVTSTGIITSGSQIVSTIAAGNAAFKIQNGTGGSSILFNGSYKIAAQGNGLAQLVADSGSLGVAVAFGSSSPSQITSDQNNYSATVSGKFIRLSSDASRNITGLTFTNTKQDGQEHVIVNVGSNNIVLVNESASSTAANRFHNSTGADITLAADQEVNCWYDATTARWRVTKRGF